jgi:transcription antitermination factor NusG
MTTKILLAICVFGIGISMVPNENPQKSEEAFVVFLEDSVQVAVDLVFTNDNQPNYYQSQIKTPVCKDSLCYLVEIELSWDLLGNFKNYRLPPKAPLTKFDHEEFDAADHVKLKKILSNKTSLLRDYDMKSLVDNSVKRSSEVVDATTGATSASIKDEVVGGALYTTHKLWHIVNGEPARKILQHTEARFDDTLLVRMLRSDEYQYQYYGLTKITADATERYLPELMRLVASGDAYVPFFAVEKLPGYVWKDAEYQQKLVTMIGSLDFEMQNEIINRLKGIPLSSEAVNQLSSIIPKLTEQQKTKVASLLKDNQ